MPSRFAFIVHPINVRSDLASRIPLVRFLPMAIIERILLAKRPAAVAHVTGIVSETGAEAEGWFIGCPLTPRQFLGLPVEQVYSRLEECGHIAESLGAEIIGLGAFSSVAGDGGITLAKRLKIAVTTGNSYTVATAVEGAARGAAMMGIRIPEATVAVVGATGSIGATCAEILARDAHKVVLIGRNSERLGALAERLGANSQAKFEVSIDVEQGLKDADVVITVSSAAQAIILPKHIKRGAVVCDVARPRDVSGAVARERDDVLVIEGGVVRVPGKMRSTSLRTGDTFSFGFPEGTAYACMSETIALALENRMESFTLGKEVSVPQADEIAALCARHGFRLDGFRSFERAVTDAEIDAIRKRAGRAEAVPMPVCTVPASPSAE